MGFLTVGLAVSFLGPGLLHLQADAGVSVQAISILFSAQALGYLFGSLLAAPGIDRQLGNRLLAGSLVGLGVMVALVPLISSLWPLAIVFCLIGAGAGAVDLASNTLLVWSRGDGVGPSMNALHFAFGVGAVSAPIPRASSTTSTISFASTPTSANMPRCFSGCSISMAISTISTPAILRRCFFVAARSVKFSPRAPFRLDCSRKPNTPRPA